MIETRVRIIKWPLIGVYSIEAIRGCVAFMNPEYISIGENPIVLATKVRQYVEKAKFRARRDYGEHLIIDGSISKMVYVGDL